MSTTRQTETIEVVTTDQRRRRWSAAEKAALVHSTCGLEMTMSVAAPRERVAASPLFQWRKGERRGALAAALAGETRR